MNSPHSWGLTNVIWHLTAKCPNFRQIFKIQNKIMAFTLMIFAKLPKQTNLIGGQGHAICVCELGRKLLSVGQNVAFLQIF
jgi:hypothetical protein